jgi:GntR family transcriptional regulator / MocR family aminotransferase
MNSFSVTKRHNRFRDPAALLRKPYGFTFLKFGKHGIKTENKLRSITMTRFINDPFKPVLDSPLYQQLYNHLQRSILTGKLKGGTKLPSTRTLAQELGVSRNTVINAYEQLMAEGYLETTSGSGTFIARVLPDHLLRTPTQTLPEHNVATTPPQPRFSRHAKSQLLAPRQFSSLAEHDTVPPFAAGAPALDAFPYKVWSRLVTRHARRMSGDTIAYQQLIGYRPLREAIAAHVTVSRHVQCSYKQVIIVSGSQGGLDLTSRLFLDPGDEVWLEDPGYLGARGALLGVGARLIPVPVDDEGLSVEAGVKRAPNAKLAFVTPSHQFPLGATMSLERRLALLEWAKHADAYILEDDYDSEFRFAGRSLPALQALDDTGRVIYIGTFSKVLFPALRIGYLIVPPALLEGFLTVRHNTDIHTPHLQQAVLADFIAEGHFSRHLRRMRKLYAERRSALLEALRDLPLEIEAPPAGIHCIGWLPEGMDDVAVAHRAAAYGLELWPVSMFCIEPLMREGIVLGYGAFNLETMKEGVRRLEQVLSEL